MKLFLKASKHPSLRCYCLQLSAALLLSYFALFSSGCARQRFVTLRPVPKNPLETTLSLLSRKGPKPSDRTEQVLRQFDLAKEQKSKPLEALDKLRSQIESEPTPDKIYSYAELSYIYGKQIEGKGKPAVAFDHYAAAVANSYRYLFGTDLNHNRNAYDPQFRRACDLYNASLESVLRIAIKQQQLVPGQTTIVSVGGQQYHLQVDVKGQWHPDDIAKLEFVSDFEVAGGLSNNHHTYGLGVPLIAVRAKHDGESAAEKYYPPGLAFPVTAFLRCAACTQQQQDDHIQPCILELHDPLQACSLEVAGQSVPLETDLTTALAFFLDNPEFQQNEDPTFGLLNPGAALKRKGMYMVEPYDPQRIPVVMVHGLWSSPTTWMEMFNDLRSFPEIRQRYQFWFYQYPTGQPFWESAHQMREVLAEVRGTLDPQRQNANLDQMILVGHSMGGLVSKLQTLESGDAFWKVLTDRPFADLKANPAEQEKLAKTFFFDPNASIRHVITIGTPHRGSTYAGDNLTGEAVRYAGQKFIKLPSMVVDLNNRVIRENPGFFTNTKLLTTTTSLDSLAPSDPLFPAMLSARKGEQTKYHNMVGVMAPRGFSSGWGSKTEPGDGIVSFTSAHLEPQELDSEEIIVDADHLAVHRHPRTTLAVREILLQHLQEGIPLAQQQPRYQPFPVQR